MNFSEKNPFLEQSENFPGINLWNINYQIHNLNSIANQNNNCISFGAHGVQETYIPNKEKDNKKEKRKICINKNQENTISNNNSSKNFIIINNNININNNSNNNDTDSQIDESKIQGSETLFLNHPNQMPNLNTNQNNNNDVVNSKMDNQNNYEYQNNSDVDNPFYIPKNENSSNNLINDNSNNININNSESNEQNNISGYTLYQLNNLNNNNNNILINDNNNNDNSRNQTIFHIKNYVEDEELLNISKMKKQALFGLKNFGYSSYFNSVLRIISNIKPIANYFSNPKNEKYFEKNIQDFPFSFVMSRLCYHLYLDPESETMKIYEPNSFMKIIQKFNVIYKGNEEKNPNEFIVFLLDKLDKELWNKKNNNIRGNIISSYLTWFKRKENKCNNCLKDTQSLQNFLTFDLNITDCYIYIRKKNIKIEDCIDFYNIQRTKRTFCNFCKKYYYITSKTKISSSSNFLIFLLDLQGNKNINFIIEQQINFDKFIENNFMNKIYELNGIVFFDINKNKYNALCLSPVDKMWYLFDDENTELFNFENFIGMYINDKNFIPYILVYNNVEKNE